MLNDKFGCKSWTLCKILLAQFWIKLFPNNWWVLIERNRSVCGWLYIYIYIYIYIYRLTETISTLCAYILLLCAILFMDVGIAILINLIILMNDLLIHFNSTSTRWALSYASRWGNHVHFKSHLHYLCSCFSRGFIWTQSDRIWINSEQIYLTHTWAI